MEAWIHFAELAMQQLRAPGLPPSMGLSDLLRLVVCLRFANPWSLVLHWDPENESHCPMIIRVWDKSKDYPDDLDLPSDPVAHDLDATNRLLSARLPPCPTIRESHAFVPFCVYDEFENLIKSHKIQIGWQGRTEFETDYYEAKLGNSQSGVTIKWWGAGPTEWQPIIKLWMNLLEKLEAYITFPARA